MMDEKELHLAAFLAAMAGSADRSGLYAEDIAERALVMADAAVRVYRQHLEQSDDD